MKVPDLDLGIDNELKMLGGRRNDESEMKKNMRTNWLDRRIFKLYELGIKWVPIPLMLAHWFGTWDYTQHPRPIVVDTADNGACIVWMYVLAYVYMPLAMLPASYFFHYCWMFRIPFLYFFGINAIRIYYRHWLLTPDMVEAHHILIIFTLILYAYGFVKIACERSKVCA